jgi:poly(hydroxyalkanoate) depolymerase family esterase
MRTLADTVARLANLRVIATPSTPSGNRLSDIGEFGSNPGALGAKAYVPPSLQPGAALVVVLHGCTQTAAGYDAGSGWSRLAEEHGFAVLYPEQSRANNPNLCFNWFNSADIERDKGEASSIRQMIGAMVARHAIDTERIFISGLSAGGAMANVMLATYPEVFAGGAIIAGLPYGAANSVPQAFDRMRGHGMPKPGALQERLAAASHHKGAWPRISVWHGTDDNTVVDANARAIVDQWSGVHDLAKRKGHVEKNRTYTRETWTDGSGRDVIDLYSIAGMGHGTPIDAQSGYGRPAPFMLDQGVSSTELIAHSWALTPPSAKPHAVIEGPRRATDAQPNTAAGRIQDVIENALRSAGLMR